jgi:hypothetical protein
MKTLPFLILVLTLTMRSEADNKGFTGVAAHQPINVKTEWIEAGGKKQIRLKWDLDTSKGIKPVKYRLYVDAKKKGSLSEDAPVALGEVREFLYTPPDGVRTYKFSLTALSSTDGASLPVTVHCMEPGRSVPAPTFTEVSNMKKESARITSFRWRCETVEQLKGFRIYRDNQILLNENALHKDARSAEAPAASDNKEHIYEIESVASDGKNSERSKAIRR